MEPWQKEYISKHRKVLVEQTTLNTQVEAILLAERVLTDVDMKQLKATVDQEKPEDATKMLFDILVTRKDSYKAIGKATFETKQTQTFHLLLRGLVQHVLQHSSIHLDEKTLDDILNSECQTEDTLKFFLNKISSGALYEDNWVPPSSDGGLYMPRFISTRVKLNPEVFRKKCPDVFVFTGLTNSKLTKLAGIYPSNSSSVAIKYRVPIWRFILLERKLHWQKLQTIFKEPVAQLLHKGDIIRPLHLIRFDSHTRDYYLEQSTQPNKILSNSKHDLPQLTDNPLLISEEQFCCHDDVQKNSRPICIFGTPGTGKTWLLENLARGIKQLDSRRMVAIIALTDFVQHLSQFSENSKTEFLTEIEILLRYLCPFRLTRIILEKALKGNKISLYLFLDGFDEILMEHLESAQRFFGFIAKTRENIKLFVTAGPNMRKELEVNFGTIMAYDILPFSEENQIDYLVQYWQHYATPPTQLNEDKLRTFALASLQSLNKSFSKEQDDLIGASLKCFLLAALNVNKVQFYCQQDSTYNLDDFIPVASIYDLYRIYLKSSMDPAMENQEKNDVCDTSHFANIKSNIKRDQHHVLKAFHVWKALQLLYPQLAENFFQKENLREPEVLDKVLACGLLQIITNNTGNTTTKFSHKTFAEYLVAEFFAEIVTGEYSFSEEDTLKKYLQIFIQDVLSVKEFTIDKDDIPSNGIPIQFHGFSFKNAILINFFNASLNYNGKNPLPSASVARIFISLLTKGQTAPILSASIASGNVQVMQLIKFILCQTPSIQVEERRDLLTYPAELNLPGTYLDDHYLSCCAYLCQAAGSSNITVVQELYSLFQEVLQENLDDVCATFPAKAITPLHYALKRRNYSVAEFFVNRISLSDRHILYECLQNTADCTPDQVETVITICKLLLEKCPLILHEKLLDECDRLLMESPAFTDRVHVELIKLLVQKGADLQAVNFKRENVLTKRAGCMGQKAFCELCRFFIQDIQAFHLFKPNSHRWDDSIPRIIGYIDEVTLGQVMQIPEIDLTGVDWYGNNSVLATILKEGELEVLQDLVARGVDSHATNHDGEGAFHLVASTGNVEMAKYLTSIGLWKEVLDDMENTPLHHSIYDLEMVKYLLLQNANIFAVNKRSNSIVHQAAKRCHEVFDYLVTVENAEKLFEKKNYSERTPMDYLFANDRFPQLKNMDLLLKLPEVVVPSENDREECVFLLAVKNNENVNVLRLLVEKGLNPTSVTEFRKQNGLHLAAKRGNLEAVQYLISLGIGLECQDYQGDTPLLLSVKNTAVTKYLISRQANIFAVDNDDNNLAHKMGNWGDLRALIDHPQTCQSILKGVNKAGRTPLHQWMAAGASLTLEIIQKLVAFSGVEVNAVDGEGRTMFLSAVAGNCGVEMLKCLLSLGSDLTKADNSGQNALHISTANGCLYTTKYLVSLGVPLEHRDNKGNTPILLGAKHLEMVKFFICQKANVLTVNADGDNIAHLIRATGYKKKTIPNKLALYLLTLPECRDLFKMTNSKGRTPVHEWIACGSKVDTLERILRMSGVDVNQADSSEENMILSASRSGCCPQMLNALRKFRANYNAVNIQGNNALHLAVSSVGDGNLHLPVVEFLTSVGCNPSQVNSDGLAPLELALSQSEYGFFPIGFDKVESVLREAQDKSGSSA